MSLIMKEEDPTIIENSSPVRSPSKTENMGMSSTNASSAAVWTPLKEEQSNQMLQEPIDTIPTDIENVSPMQHLMSDDGNTRRKSLRKSDDDEYNDDHQPAKPIHQKKVVLSFILCLIVCAVAGGVVAAVLILQNKNSSSSSTSSSSNSETNNPPTTPIAPPIPAPASIGNNATNNSSTPEAPTMMPSNVDNDNNNSTNTNTTMTPTATPVTSNMTNETFVPSATPTNSTGLPTTLAPTFFNVPTFDNTTTPTVAPVTVPAPTVSADNSAKLLSVLGTFLLPSDNAALSSSTDNSIYKQSFDEMIATDSYFTTLSDDVQIFQRYIITTLNLHFQVSPTSTTVKPILVNSVTDHCTWIGIECNMNTTDSITDNLVTDLVWTGYSFIGTIPDTIQYLSSLTKLDFGDNQLTGTIPSILYNNLTSLEYLFLHSNQFIGTISNDGIGQLSLLKRLYLGNNRFSGSLPDNIGLAKEMTYLNMYNNSFSGKIPLTWNLRYLFYLDLGRNQLTGSIPANWPIDLFDVRIFYINHNQLSGSFPGNFTRLGNNRISLLQVSDNQLTGIIPSGFNRRQLDLSEFQHNSFTSMDEDFCRNIVWIGGEMISMRSDCGATCPCQYFCGANECY